MNVLAGRPIAAVIALAISAPLATAAAPAPPGAPAAPVTFARDIAPLVFEHCVRCHRPGGSAPFPLVTYQDVRSRARPVVAAVTRRAMPPWKPEPGYGEFVGARRLSDAQIATFEEWLAQDSPPGDLGETPPLPRLMDDWELGTPDLVLRVSPSYRLPPGGGDRMRNFAIPVPPGAERYVKAWQFRTDTPQVVHHATMVVDDTAASRRLDDADAEPGFEGLIPLSAQNPEGFFLGWTPGQRASQSPEPLAWQLPAGSDLVMMLHLKPSGRWEEVNIAIALYFTDAPPRERGTMIRMNRQDLDIPAGERHYAVKDSYTLPVPVTVYSLQPHAHNLARQITATATLPDGTTQPLLYIREWDFHWQDAYRYVRPVTLPAGTRLDMQFVYDNSGANPANPSFPPQRVTYGQRTSDEMGDLWIQVVPERQSDLPALNASLRRELLPKSITGYRMMIASDPGNADLRNDLALLYIEAQAYENAAVEFGAALKLTPAAPAAHYNVANAKLLAGRFSEAEGHFRTALTLDPDYGLAHQGLGLALRAAGRLDEAASHLEQAARLTRTPDAHYNLGILRQQQQRPAEALVAYREAVRLDPRFFDAHVALGNLEAAVGHCARAAATFGNALATTRQPAPAVTLELAWALATCVDPSVRNAPEALRLAESAGAALPAVTARALDVLGAALAANGRFDEAIAAAERALAAIAPAETGARLAIEERLRAYRGGVAWREPPAGVR